MSESFQHLKGQVAIVTGASRGIGRAIAAELASEGANLVLTARGVEGVEAAAAALAEDHPDGRFLPVGCDVSNWDSVSELIDRTVEEFEKIDFLVNNAGITRDNLVMRMKKEEWEDVLAANLTGVFNTCRLAARQMLRQRSGRIVNITSVVGLLGNAGQVNYAASKGGIISLTYSLAREMASRGVLVNAVAPGRIKSARWLATIKDRPGVEELLEENPPLHRLGEPEDVARAVEFFVTDLSRYVTGEVLRVDGGIQQHFGSGT